LGVGPGSFTGIRVGTATAKMLALVWKKKIVAVSSLESLAFSAGRAGDGPVAVLVDARKGKVYAALYEIRAGKMRTLVKPSLTTAESFLKRLRRPVRLAGNNRQFLEGFLPNGSEKVYVEGEEPIGAFRASTIMKVALDKITRKEYVSPERLEPLYLHPRDCNVTKKKK
jgi:tRNA threonylcarbamoyl adenosine modification protein YeaZ